jgi:hypothetical protein
MNPVVQAPLDLVVNLDAKSGQAPEGRLDMAARTAKPVVQVEVAKGGVEVVTPHQADDAAAQPDTFGVPGRTIDGLGCFSEFIGPALVIPRGIGRTARRLGGLIGGGGCPTLGEGGAGAQDQRQPGNNEIAQNRDPPVNYPLTHEFPNLVPAHTLSVTHADQIGPQYGGIVRQNPMAEILDFVQQAHNFIAPW